ncbi:hypothetical protein GCM10029964_121330 [Kibdelosporangium lantanae]
MTEPTLNYVSKTDMVVALIRELIITGELPAGKQLRQRDLAARFHVSQTPVREAMRRLESEGLVVGDAHRGFTVVEADSGSTEENYRIRAALEALGAELAAPGSTRPASPSSPTSTSRCASSPKRTRATRS